MLGSCLSLCKLSLTSLEWGTDPWSIFLRHGNKGPPTTKVTQLRSSKDEMRGKDRHETLEGSLHLIALPKIKWDPRGKRRAGLLMVGKRDWGEPYCMFKWNSSLQVFKYVHVYSHSFTNHAKIIGLEGSSSSTTWGKNTRPLIKRALKGLKWGSSVRVRMRKIF